MLPLYINYPSFIKPEIFSFLPIRWYSLMYIVAFFVSLVLFKHLAKKEAFLNKDEVENIMIAGFLGLIIFSRIFSCLFYSDWRFYLTHPLHMFWPFEGGKFVGLPGMSYHGGLFGCVVGVYLYCKKKKFNALKVGDFAVAVVPFGYTFGRLGNFINEELYGRVTTSSLGMIFPGAKRFDTNLEWVKAVANKVGLEIVPNSYINLPRHPSQLYEALFEGLITGIIIYFIARPFFKKNNFKDGSAVGLYLILYGFFRFLIEYCRQPDADIGYVIALGEKSDNIALFQSFLNISKGQIFCLLMIIIGLIMMLIVNRKGNNNVKKYR
ncbi:MAG: prolipoprotein diacylglyceryl transferase [Sphaerochaetaceae bacterium]|nr:prolipoprotein diacylglyceryl transferase [Sphaerochaetaceae bacterium]